MDDWSSVVAGWRIAKLVVCLSLCVCVSLCVYVCVLVWVCVCVCVFVCVSVCVRGEGAGANAFLSLFSFLILSLHSPLAVCHAPAHHH